MVLSKVTLQKMKTIHIDIIIGWQLYSNYNKT